VSEASPDTKQRDGVLGAAVLAANIFLIAFTVDATFSVIDELLHFASFTALTPVRNFVAELVVFAAFIMGVVLVFTPRLPKRVLLPPILFALWCDFGAPPFGIIYQSHTFDLLIAIAQLVLAGIAFALIYLRTQGWLLKAESLPHKDRIALRIAGNFATSVIVLFLAMIVLSIVSFGALITRETHGYIQFGLTSVEAQETTLVKGRSTVRLVGMVHIAEPQFYQSLIDTLPPHGLVLAEGVTDNQKLLAKGLSYRNAAHALGLQQQPSLALALEQRHEQEAAKPAAQQAALPTIEDADIDISSFTPTTIRFLREVSDLYRGHSLGEVMARFSALQKKFTPHDYTVLMTDIIDKRNRNLLAQFNAQETGHDMIVIPWGAEHMPFMEASLRAQGYRITAQDVRRVAGYGTMLGALFHRS
jgi:hypothetical protein